MAYFKLTEDEYRARRRKRDRILNLMSTASMKTHLELSAVLADLDEEVKVCERLFPEWIERYDNFVPATINLSYPDKEINGLSELFKIFREIFVIILPKESRKCFARCMTDYLHQFINVSKKPTFIEERERFNNYIQIRFKLK